MDYWRFHPSPQEPFPTIPLRYLIYTPEETPQVQVNLYLPAGIELVNAKDYPVSQEENRTKALVYSGPMRFKECKAFYLQVQVKPFKQELFPLEIKTQATNLKNEEFFKQDKVDIDLKPKRY